MSTLHACIHTGLIPLTYSIKEEVSSINGSPRGQTGKSGEAAEGLCVQHEAPMDTTKGQQGVPQPSCAPHLPPGLQAQDADPSPSAAATELGVLLLAGCPQAPSSGGPSLAKGTFLGQAMEQERGLTPFTARVARKGGGKATLTQQHGSSLYLRFALVQAGMKAAPSP